MGVKFARTKGPRAVSLMKGKERTGPRNSPFTSRFLPLVLFHSLFPSLRSSSLVLNLNLPQVRTRISRRRTRDSIRTRCFAGCRDAESSRGMRCNSSSLYKFRALINTNLNLYVNNVMHMCRPHFFLSRRIKSERDKVRIMTVNFTHDARS